MSDEESVLSESEESVPNYMTTEVMEHNEAGDCCCICCENDERTFLRIECGHIFHAHCIATWFRSNPVCPLCRDNPVMEPVDAIARATYVRRQASNARATPLLKRMVSKLRQSEMKLKQHRRALKDFRNDNRSILKRLNYLQRLCLAARRRQTRHLMMVGTLDCPGSRVPPLSEYR